MWDLTRSPSFAKLPKDYLKTNFQQRFLCPGLGLRTDCEWCLPWHILVWALWHRLLKSRGRSLATLAGNCGSRWVVNFSTNYHLQHWWWSSHALVELQLSQCSIYVIWLGFFYPQIAMDSQKYYNLHSAWSHSEMGTQLSKPPAPCPSHGTLPQPTKLPCAPQIHRNRKFSLCCSQEIQKTPPLVISLTDMPEKCRVHSCVGTTCLISQPDQKWAPVPSQRSSEAASYWQQILITRGSTTFLFSQKSLLPATAEFKEEKLSKPKEVAHWSEESYERTIIWSS